MLARPGVLVLFVECENVDLRGFNVVDAPNWSIHLACCRHAVMNGLNVLNSLLIPNADAIDVSNSQDVRISEVYLEAGDDGIAIGACAIGYCCQMAENVTVSNAVIVSRSAAIRIGWSANDIRDLVFNNIINPRQQSRDRNFRSWQGEDRERPDVEHRNRDPLHRWVVVGDG
jgi:polygalacturonase